MDASICAAAKFIKSCVPLYSTHYTQSETGRRSSRRGRLSGSIAARVLYLLVTVIRAPR